MQLYQILDLADLSGTWIAHYTREEVRHVLEDDHLRPDSFDNIQSNEK